MPVKKGGKLKKRTRLPVGRPSTYDPLYAEKFYEFALLGLTKEEIARVIGISIICLYKWLDRYPELVEALRRGGDEADARVVKALYKRATGYEQPAVKIFMPAGADEPVYADYAEHYPPDVAAATLWLINRQRGKWQAKQSVEMSGPDGAPLVAQPLKIEFIDPQPSEPVKK